jgi:adenylylsulfate kinase-like enzyme
VVIWLVGLAGAGKTEIGRELSKLIKKNNQATIFLDGDHFRQIMNYDVGHTIGERKINGERICRMCKYLDQQNINVVCSILSIFPKQREWNRSHYSRYFETYIDVSMNILEARDQKGLYSGARSGTIKNVVGIDLEFIPPINPDLVISNNESIEDFSNIAKFIKGAIDKKFSDLL